MLFFYPAGPADETSHYNKQCGRNLLAVISSGIFSRFIDSEVKCWNTENGVCIRTYRGHTNNIPFLEFTITPDFIACGIIYMNFLGGDNCVTFPCRL